MYLPSYVCMYPVVKIVKPPGNITVCYGSSVNISCGYQSNTTLNVGWHIGNVIYGSDSILSRKMYQVNNSSNPLNYSLTVRFVEQNTTFRCIVESNSSTPGTVTVMGMYVRTYVRRLQLVLCIDVYVCTYVHI